MDKIDKASSDARMQELEKEIHGVIQKLDKQAKKKGHYTVYELTAVFSKVTHHYSQRGLTYQHEQALGLPEDHGPREVGQDGEVIHMKPQGEA